MLLSDFSFGATPAIPVSSSGLSFGATASASAPPAGNSFGGGFSVPSTSSGFNFGPRPSATPSPSLSFNASAVSSSTVPSYFGGTGPSTFGNGSFTTSAIPQTATWGGIGSFGSGSAAAQPVATVQSVGPPITLETAFEALPENVMRNIAQFYAFLKEQDQIDTFLKTVSPGQLEVLHDSMARLEQEVLARQNRQDRQTFSVQHLRQDVRHLLHQVDAATLTRRSLDSSSKSGPLNMYNVTHRVEMPSPYYWDLVDHYEQKMAVIKTQIQDVEALLQPLLDGRDESAKAREAPATRQLQQILLVQNAALMQAAARVAEVHEKAEEMRRLCLAKMREDFARQGDKHPAAFQNPFIKRKMNSETERRQAIDKMRFRTSVAPTIVTPQPAAPAATPLGFGFGNATSNSPTSRGGYNFGVSAPAKAVSFNLTSTAATSATPFATTTSVTATPISTNSAVGFLAPTVATSGFGNNTSSFTTPDAVATVGTKRGGRAQKMRR
ncbi:hypothetical protein CCR75_008113 [Bremia lactucae]|uniref:Nucleoporin Nup54 alpha-helical domain-containing protein n=1 Tax=Bremia lactucae TaxID=4779 RepID=A0A976FMD0_BRELC|nr:hypothetical protein CCR75_008113 [Bremia lactucae]